MSLWTAVCGLGGIAYASIVFVYSFLGGDSFLGKRCVLDVAKFEIPTLELSGLPVIGLSVTITSLTTTSDGYLVRPCSFTPLDLESALILDEAVAFAYEAFLVKFDGSRFFAAVG